MASVTALNIRTVKVKPFKNGCNRIPRESKKKAKLNGIPASLPLSEKYRVSTTTNNTQDKSKENLKIFSILLRINR